MNNFKKRILPERKNRGLHMAELAKNEEKLMNDAWFQIESSDDEFNPDDNHSENNSNSNENFSNFVGEGNAESEAIQEVEEKITAKNKKKKEEEILDIENLDIDKIDYWEDLRDKGIDIDEEDFDMSEKEEKKHKDSKKKKKKGKKVKRKKYFASDDESNEDEDDENYGTNRKKNKKLKFVHKPKSKQIKAKEKEIEEIPNIPKKESSKVVKNIKISMTTPNEHDIGWVGRKRTRTNKVENFWKKPKRDKINKNVTIHGSRHNPKSIIINKNIYKEEPEEEELNSGNENQTEKGISFNLEQEEDTKKIIEQYKQQEKDKKLFGFHDKIITQKDRWLESIITELINVESWREMQRLDDVTKQINTSSNKKELFDSVKTINTIKTTIKNENNQTRNSCTVYFKNGVFYNKIFDFFNRKPKEVNKDKKVCAITGMPAKYFDPLTKSYYSTIDAFKWLRERYFQKEEDGLLFRIQTLSDWASQKKERLKKMILIDNSNLSNMSATNNINTLGGSYEKQSTGTHGMPQIKNNETNSTKDILSIINKYGILKTDSMDYEKKVINHRIYNRNRENCVDSGMWLEANKIKWIISKKIFKDKYSSKIPLTEELPKVLNIPKKLMSGLAEGE